LKYLPQIAPNRELRLLIVPEGIEMRFKLSLCNWFNRLLIVPEGIEITQEPILLILSTLLIVPEGIEINF